MSSPIAIPRSKSSSSSSASSSLSSAPTTPTSAGLYVPVHKRTGSSSRTDPSSARLPAFSVPEAPKQHSRVYTANFLLSLRPNADESLKEKIRASCPEVVMNRRTRKNLEFAEHQHLREAATIKRTADWHSQQQHRPLVPTLSIPAPVRVATPVAPTPARVTPRKNRPAGRAPERRRQALQSSLNLNDSWRDIRRSASTPLPVV